MDALFFKMILPVKYMETENAELNTLLVDLMQQNLIDARIVEKNSKKFYYEIKCMIMDVNPNTK